jgi:hypothetical protein
LEPNWEGTRCAYCNNILEDRIHAAQVRFTGADGKSQLHFFDDLGCAVLWLKDHPEADGLDARIWVTDLRSGVWIDARTATFVAGQASPQHHGIGAQWESHPRGMNFDQARASILEAQAKTGTHPGHIATPAGPSPATPAR